MLLGLAAIQAPTWGDTVVEGGFVPSAASWQRFVAQRLDAAAAQAERTDCALGTLAGSLRDAAHTELGELDDAPISLVHGNLVPSALLLGAFFMAARV